MEYNEIEHSSRKPDLRDKSCVVRSKRIFDKSLRFSYIPFSYYFNMDSIANDERACRRINARRQ
jgi:hypothetical protein